ncbi:MAG: ATP phosphoribosyltransferase [Acidobacteriota bacterium]
MAKLTIALAKGRLQDDALEIFACAGVRIAAEQLASRRLLIEDQQGEYNFVFVKPADVPVYVEYGVADVGICGRDVLLERAADVHTPLDLGIGYCRLVVAGKKEEAPALSSRFSALRIATKYPRITAEYFQRRAVPVEIIELSGSIELAPLLGLADRIVDLVETGRTLRENGLELKEVIAESTAQLIVNRASFQLKRTATTKLIECLAHALERQSSQGSTCL